MPEFPNEVTTLLRVASEKSKKAQKRFVCRAFKNAEWNQFVEEWASRSYVFVANAFGGYQKEPLIEIIAMHDGAHSGGANASFNPGNGQITLSSVMEGKPGITLEKVTHELTHAALASFPDDDGFHTEGYVDYSVWIMAHAPAWEPYRTQMIQAAAFNIEVRRDRALKAGSDWDRKRWAGGLHAHLAYGPHVIPRLRQKKLEGDFTW
jgi:hypothetical protein